MGMPMFKRSMAVLLVIIAVAAGVTMWEMYDGDEVQLLADNRLSAEDEQAGKNACDTRQVAVYVTGEVQQPGVVYVAGWQMPSMGAAACFLQLTWAK